MKKSRFTESQIVSILNEADAGMAVKFGGAEIVVESVGDEEIVKRTELLRPFPNPFNPTTRIEFTVKNPGEVRLSIYDVRGRLVRDLENGHRDAGRYEAMWSGQDHSDQRVASGVYFARMQADGETMTQRLLLIK